MRTACRVGSGHGKSGLKRTSSSVTLSGDTQCSSTKKHACSSHCGWMWTKESSHTICLSGCIGSDPLEKITWLHFLTWSFQIRPIQTPILISLVPETVFPPTIPPQVYCPKTNLSLIFRELPGLGLISDQRNLHLWFSLVCTFSSHGIHSHLAVLASRVPRLCPVWLCRWELTARIKWALRSMVIIHWIEESTTAEWPTRPWTTFFGGVTGKWKYGRVLK